MYSLHVMSSIIYYVIISLNMIYNDYNELLHKDDIGQHSNGNE
jgi:hypothetical protein